MAQESIEDVLVNKLADAINKGRIEMGESPRSRVNSPQKPDVVKKADAAKDPVTVQNKQNPVKAASKISKFARIGGPIGVAATVAGGLDMLLDTLVQNQRNPIENEVTPLNLPAPAAGAASGAGMATEVTPEQQLAETLLGAVAEQAGSSAQARTNATMSEVGSKPTVYKLPPGTPLATFGNTKVKKTPQGNEVTIEPVAQTTPAHELNLVEIADRQAKGIKGFDLEAEFNKLKTIEDDKQREDFVQLLMLNISDRAATLQRNIRDTAAQRAGVNDAQTSWDTIRKLEAAAVQMGRIKPGDVTIQGQRAQARYQAALAAANALEQDLVKGDPELTKLNMYAKLIERQLGQVEKTQARKDAIRDKSPVIMTDERLANVKYALNLTETDSKSLENKAYNGITKDKALLKVIEASKETIPILLVDEDPVVRKYAYNILVGHETKNGLEPIPGYVKALEKLVTNREALLTPELAKQISLDQTKVTGEKEKSSIKFNTLVNSVSKAIEETGRVKYQRMDLWAFNDPAFKSVIDGLKVKNKDGKVLMSDGIEAIMRAELKNADGSIMRPQDKIKRLQESLKISMDNDKASFILPSASNYYEQYAYEVRNQANRAYLYSNKEISLVPGFPLSGGINMNRGE